MTNPFEYDFSFVQGDSFAATWPARVSVAGKSARLKLKKNPDDTAALELTQAAGLTLTGSNIAVAITAEDSADIAAGRYQYDLKLIDGASVTTLRRGYVDVIAQISDED